MSAAEFTWPDVLAQLLRGESLAPSAVSWAMGEILAGNATPVQIAGFAVALRAKGEAVEEISALADTMLARATPISLDEDAVDVVGSGGDRANTVNVSTMAAIVAAAAGARVVKHGNRAASSACGTADCLEELGVALDVPAAAQAEVLADVGIVFLFAPLYHPSLRHSAGPRRELGIPTTFNFLGPLANPARPAAQAIGVADARMAGLMAGVLAGRGSRGLVFHGSDGLDELTTTTTSDVWILSEGRAVTGELDPADLGIPRGEVRALVGGGPAQNAAIVRDTFAGAVGPVRDIVVLNAAAALLAYHGPDPDGDVVTQLAPYVAQATEALDSGRATGVLDRWVETTRRFRQV
ncbi:anthranilate phosphoribosyltransferase [Propionicicella superfundia]|uniref:anthranilate phosphoribosyltransferase n=1 Tax=Propionicicella superfundia TaxID=348582 RepID=UPI00040FAE86|nr:anthranilate phosphoribosyltransferase [Propionicicella superfundia]